MNTFFAVLKDSYREAIDAKILYVMVGLSLLVVLVTFSLSFEPAKPERAISHMVETAAVIPDPRLPGMAFRYDSSLRVELKPQSLEELTPGKGPAHAAYRFKLLITPGNTGQVQAGPAPAVPAPDGKAPAVPVPADKGKTPEVMPNELRVRVANWSHTPEEDQKKISLQQAAEFLQSNLREYCGFKRSVVTAISGEAREAVFQVDTPEDGSLRWWPYKIDIFFGAVTLFGDQHGAPPPLARTIYFLEDIVVNSLGAWFTLLISVIITAGFIPNMLRKGSIDLLLAKPMGRVTLLLYKYVGGLIFILINTMVAFGGIWLVIGVRTGIWGSGFLFAGLLIVYFFAVLYALSTFYGVFTRSTVAVILLTIFTWFVFFLIGYINLLCMQAVKLDASNKGTFPDVMKTLNWMTPRTKDLDRLNTSYIASDLFDKSDLKLVEMTEPPELMEVMWVTWAWMAFLLGLSSWRMAKRDF